MKRIVILILICAILVSMAVVSFSLYTTTFPIGSTVIRTKVFDISMTDTVDETQLLENTPSWVFMVFKSDAADTDFTYDMNVQITLSSVITDTVLEAVVCNDSGTELARSSFVDGIADLTVPGFFAKGEAGRKSMNIKYYYGGLPVSTENIPAAARPDTATRVTVRGIVSQ